MKKIILSACIVILAATTGNGQFYKSILPSPAFTDSLNNIISSFKNNYYAIQGDAVSAGEDVDIYQSNSSVPGATECYIYRFHSVVDTTASLQAVMYKGDSYKEAVKIYKNTFRLVNKTKLKLNSGSGSFSGILEEPTETLRFTSSHLNTISNDAAYKNFIAEVEMVNNFTEWEVRLNLHSKKDDKDKYMQ